MIKLTILNFYIFLSGYMAVDKILKGLLDNFTKNTIFDDLDDTKKYEYLVNKLVVSKYAPESFADLGDMENIDVDAGDLFGLDSIAFIVNGNLVFSKEDIEKYAISKRLDVEILFFQTKTESGIDAGAFLRFTKAVKIFCNGFEQLKGTKNEALLNAKEIYDSIFLYDNYKLSANNSPRFILYFVYAGTQIDVDFISALCQSEAKSIKAEVQDIKEVSIHILGRNEIISEYEEFCNRVKAQIYLKDCVSLDKINGVKSAYIGCLSGKEYLNLITDANGLLRRRIFFENVRDYQGYDNSVNKEIRETIRANKNDQFVLLNNGVTIISKDIISLGSNQYEINNFQIVNGCQTSNEIYNEREKAQSIMVPIKLIATEDPDFISMVIRSTNRQSPVPDEAFITLEKYHKQLQLLFEQYSNEMPLKIFYERRMHEGDNIHAKDTSYNIVKLHGIIRNVTSVYFKEAYVVHNNNPANILRNRRNKLFSDNHPYDIYYIASYLFEEMHSLQERGILSSRDYIFRNYIIMVTRMLMVKSTVVPPFDSKQMKNECSMLVDLLKNDCSSFFVKARYIIEEVVKQIEFKQYPYRVLVRKPDFCEAVILKVNTFLQE